MSHYSSLAIANEFLERAQNSKRELTHMQLQKHVYLAHGWNLAVNGKPLIEDDVEAWEFGPVIRKLYDALSHYGSGPISRLIRWGDDTPAKFMSNGAGVAKEKLPPQERAVIEKVWETYGGFKAFQLSALTHAEGSPWQKVYDPNGRSIKIKNDSIQDYFVDLSLKNAA